MKYQKYQDYVIKDGEFVGDFEQMYQDHENPWRQQQENDKLDKKIIMLLCEGLMKNKGCSKLVDLGCGQGCFTHTLYSLGYEVLGIDISETAIKKAKVNFPNIVFKQGELFDSEIVSFKPDVIVDDYIQLIQNNQKYSNSKFHFLEYLIL